MHIALKRHPIAEALERSLGMFVVTDCEGVAVYANESAERRTGYGVAEIVGKKPGQLWGGHMPREFYKSLWRDIRQGKPVVTTIRNERKDGRRYAERVHIATLTDSKQQPRFFIAAEPFHLESQERLDQFGSEFTHVFGSGKALSDTRFVEWMARWFTAERGESVHTVATQSAVGFIEQELVNPLRERFVAREEDRVLIEAAQADAREFRLLYVKYESLVRQYFLRHLGYDRDTADDLTQDTFYRALSALKGFTCTNASYGTYVLRVAHNILVNHYRKKRTVRLLDGQEEEYATRTVAPAYDMSEQWLNQTALRPEERHILSLKYREGFSIHEIAALYGTSENAVKLRLSRARKHLKHLL